MVIKGENSANHGGGGGGGGWGWGGGGGVGVCGRTERVLNELAELVYNEKTPPSELVGFGG